MALSEEERKARKRERDRRWRAANPDIKKERDRKYYLENLEKERERHRIKDAKRRGNPEWQEKRKEYFREYFKEYINKHYTNASQEEKDKYKAKVARWKQANPDKVREINRKYTSRKKYGEYWEIHRLVIELDNKLLEMQE